MIKFYKAKGALQIRLLPPRMNEKGYLDKEGALLLEAAPGTGSRQNPSWNWDQKISFAISVADIMAMCDDDTVDIFHKSKDTPKKLQVNPGQQSGYFLSLAQGKGSNRHQVSVPLTDGEWRVLIKVFVDMIPTLVGWYE